ncbi:MAG: sugar phosphate isomerase/epimerase [Propionibacteriaceae bacterium]|jgi:sugar phosphate isomerase/epimerase|nr:sugar phosphate isomerase/epimerase [Propionibacteriaceae bacterium]
MSAPKLSMNATVTWNANVVDSIRIAKAAGFAGIELQTPWLDPYLDAGFAPEELVAHLDGLSVSGVGALHEAEPEAFAAQAGRLAALTAALGGKQMQMCTGPVDVSVVKDHWEGCLADGDPRYRGAVGWPDREALELTAANLATAADIAAGHGLDVYLEPLGWAPVNSTRQAAWILETINRPNAGLTVDLWHCYVAGETPEDVASLDPALIKAVHVCDGLPLPAPDTIPDQAVYRNVWTGGGIIPLQEYVDAVKSTGYNGWYCAEIFCPKTAQIDSLLVATALRANLEVLVS